MKVPMKIAFKVIEYQKLRKQTDQVYEEIKKYFQDTRYSIDKLIKMCIKNRGACPMDTHLCNYTTACLFTGSSIFDWYAETLLLHWIAVFSGNWYTMPVHPGFHD